MLQSIKKLVYRVVDVLLTPFGLLAAFVFRSFRQHGIRNFPLHQNLFRTLGVFPIRDHYYEPQFKFPKGLDLHTRRHLHIDLREEAQLALLKSMDHVTELRDLHSAPAADNNYYLDNPAFGPGDAEAYYLMIRNKKPKRIIEIGSGFSTKLALSAIRKNREEGHITQLTCIEPYEMPWLDGEKGIELIRTKVEESSLALFSTLETNDILFIDSSHIIRPENDVLFEYLTLIPQIPKGVLIHIHDIFTPRNYPDEWLIEEHRFWNEQYLLEALLSYSKEFRVLLSVNHLKHQHFSAAREVLIHLQEHNEPGSFWIERV